MDPTTMIEAVPTEYGMDGWVVGVAVLSVVAFGGFMVWFFAKQYSKQQKSAHDALERAFEEQAKDRNSHEQIVREVIQSHNYNQERLADKIEDLADAVKDMARDRAANVR